MDQQLLLPADLREWLRSDHLALYVSDLVDQLDLGGIMRAYVGVQCDRFCIVVSFLRDQASKKRPYWQLSQKVFISRFFNYFRGSIIN